MLAPIVSSLKRSEKIMFNFILEQYPILQYMGKISVDTAKYLIGYTIDLMLYDNIIGRDVNFRFSDETSVWKTSNPKKYFERLFKNEGKEAFENLQNNSSLSVLATTTQYGIQKFILKHTLPSKCYIAKEILSILLIDGLKKGLVLNFIMALKIGF